MRSGIVRGPWPWLVVPVLAAPTLGIGSSNLPSPGELPRDVRDLVAATWPAMQASHRARVEEAGIVGSSLVLVIDGVVAARSDVGWRDLDRRLPVDERTIFHWASITKTLTGIAIMQLRDRGLLALDDPVVTYLPEVRQVHNPYGDMRQVTIRHLLSHTSGLRAATWPWGGSEPWHPFEPTSWAQLVAMFPYTRLEFPPGSRYGYSNPGIVLLGRIIEHLAGEDYEVYVTKNLLMPLGMRSSFFDRAPYHLLPDRSRSYFRSATGLREARFDFDTGITVSNGGLNGPVDDLVRYLAFLAGSAPAGSVEAGVLARTSLEEMWQPQVDARGGEGVAGDHVFMGLTFFLERHRGLDLVGHSGSQNGFLSHFYVHPPSRSGYVVAYNTDVSTEGPPPRELTREVDAALRDELVMRLLAPVAAGRRGQ